MKRISFSQYDAIHLYEALRFSWIYEFKEDKKFVTKKVKKELGKFGGCYECENIGNRLEKFIEKKEVIRFERLLKKQGY